MKRLLIGSTAAVALFLTGAIAAASLVPSSPVTSSQVAIQSATVVQPAVITMDGTWKDIPSLESITLTGRLFFTPGKCALTNMDGNGPDYRLMVGISVDGAPHGEVRSWFVPTYGPWYYEDAGWPGSAIENIDPASPSSHTFKVQIWGITGRVAIGECNFSVLSYQ